jgi:hypothetical protein
MAPVQLKSPLKNLSIYGSKGLIVIYGYNEITGLYSVLEINRPVITTDGGLRMKQLPQELSLNQMIARKKNMQLSYKDMELLYENVHCLYGSIKLLDSQYLILVTRKSKIGSIVGHAIYSIDDIAILPVTFGMKSSADEVRYRALLSTFDLTKYLYFSYTYDLTKSYQSQISSSLSVMSSSSPSSVLPTLTSTTSSNSNRSPCQHMFVWNSFAMKPFLRGGLDGQSLDHWCVPVIYGYINQRNIQLQSPTITLKFLLIARRSRLFAGTRYLRRGVDMLGNVANEVETEQIFYLMSSQPGFIPRVTSLIQCRGSIPLFWSHTNLYSPKPDVQLESDLDMRLIASKKHFENLFIRYGFNINVLNLVKQVDSKGEVMLGAAYQETCETLNQAFIDMKNLYKNSRKNQQQQQQTIAPLTAPGNTSLSPSSEEGETDEASKGESGDGGRGGGAGKDREAGSKERGDVTELSPITYIAYDFLTMAKYQHIAESEGNRNGPNVFRDVNRICEGIYGNIGFYVDPPVDPSPSFRSSASTSTSPVFLHFPIIQLPFPSPATSADLSISNPNDSSSQDPSALFSTPSSASNSSNEMNDLFYELLAGDHPTHSLHSDEFLSSLNPTNTLGTGSPTGLLQNGILRTNCMDCLDRTNVAQFCYAKLNIMKQLKAIGINLLTSGLQEVTSICMEVWAEHGDAIAIQYGGSGAMHKVDKQERDPSSSISSTAANAVAASAVTLQQQQQQQQLQGNAITNGNSSSPSVPSSSDQEFRLTGGSKNALVAVQRYYSNISTDYDRQQSIDLLLGIYEPKKNTVPIWEERLRTQHLRYGVRGRRQSDLMASSLHDLNLLKQLDKVTKKEKVRNELVFLQMQQQQGQQGLGLGSAGAATAATAPTGGRGGGKGALPVVTAEGKGSSAAMAPAGDFLILHEDEDDEEEEEHEEDEEHEEGHGDDEEVEEIWDDSPEPEQEQEQPQQERRKSIRIPLPGYQTLGTPSKPFHHIASVALDSLTEFSDLVEDSELEVVNLQEVSLLLVLLPRPLPPLPLLFSSLLFSLLLTLFLAVVSTDCCLSFPSNSYQ